jgi:hypothetical protein
MSMLIAAFVCIALLTISIAHFVWGFGFTWPLRDRKLLAQTVVGFTGIEKMPNRLITLAIAAISFYGSMIALAIADHDGGGVALNIVGGLIGAIFLARGVIGYTPQWQAMTAEPIFRLNDRRVYSPICIFIGLGFFTLIVLRLL